MNTMIAFDTLAFAKRLRNAGFSNEQAEAHVEVFQDMLESALVTKDDIRKMATKDGISNWNHGNAD